MQNFWQKLSLQNYLAIFFVAIFIQVSFAKKSYATFSPIDSSCLANSQASEEVLNAVKEKNPDAIKSLSNCIKYNHKLIFQALLLDPSQLADADDIFRKDENFIKRLVKVNPEILKYVAPELKNDQHFIEETTFINRNSLKYADEKLLDKKPFMAKMIKNDAQNYIYASNRLKEMPEITAPALTDDGMLLRYAPESIKENRAMVKIAIQSNSNALDFAADNFKKDVEMLLITGQKAAEFDKKKAADFLQKNYITEEKKRNIGAIFDKRTKFFKKNRIINRNYITKWQRVFEFNGHHLQENIRLITAESRNNPNRWTEDLKQYPDLIKKIQAFFLKRQIDRDTIDNLSLTYLWKIKNDPLTLAFNLYLLRDSNDDELGVEYVNTTSLTAIVQKNNKEWHLTVIETIFDNETKADVAYEDGEKKYILQDLYIENKSDKNPKLLFRVEDKFREYFEIFGEQKGGKYQMLYRFDPLAIDDAKE